MKQTKRPTNIAFRIAMVLLCLVLVSFHMMSGLYARYTAGGSGSDSARVASFSVSAVGKNPDSTAVDGSSGAATYVLTVTNHSEVAVRYTVTLSFENGLPEWVTGITVGGTPMTVSGDRKVATAAVSGTLAVGGAATENIVFTASTDGLTGTVSGDSNDVSGSIKFAVNVNFTQID